MQQLRIDELVQKFLTSKEGLTVEEMDELDRLLSGWNSDSRSNIPEDLRKQSDDLNRLNDLLKRKNLNHKEITEALLALSHKNKERVGRMDARIHHFLEQNSASSATESSSIEANSLHSSDHLDPHGESCLNPLKPSSPRYRRFSRYLAAASLAGLIGWGGWSWISHKTSTAQESETKPATHPNDALPGTNKAILTLADGSKIVLDSSMKAALPDQGNSRIEKVAVGKLAYKILSKNSIENSAPILFNTVTTPRGGQYEVVLPDGSKVWLNSGSSLRFPTLFTGNQRKIEITGEAYLEIEKNPSMPFIVKVGELDITVLGTSFNINAYTDEPFIATTLLTGSILVKSSGQEERLQPGQQARVAGNTFQVDEHINLKQVIAWKDGLFRFNHTDIQTVMRELSRWYNVSVVYEGNIKSNIRLTGSMDKNLNASEVLKILEINGVHFRMDGAEKIVVLP